MRRRGSLEAMSTVDVSAEALDAARREAERRGVDVSVVISAAIQRFVVAADLADLLDDLREQDAGFAEPLSAADALHIANEEIAATRHARDLQPDVPSSRAHRSPRGN